MTNQQVAPEALHSITRYEVVDCIDSKHVPAVIPNRAGPWVRYEDHVAALVEAQQPAPSAAAAVEAERGGLRVAIRSAIQAARYHFSDPIRRDATDRVLLDLLDDINARSAAAPQSSPTAQAAGSVPAVEREQERIAFKDAHRHLDLDEVPDAWGRPMFKHSHVEASWLGWIARASHGQALRLLTQKEKDSLGRRAEGMDGNEWDQWVQEKFAQVNGLRVQGGSYEWDWE